MATRAPTQELVFQVYPPEYVVAPGRCCNILQRVDSSVVDRVLVVRRLLAANLHISLEALSLKVCMWLIQVFLEGSNSREQRILSCCRFLEHCEVHLALECESRLALKLVRHGVPFHLKWSDPFRLVDSSQNECSHLRQKLLLNHMDTFTQTRAGIAWCWLCTTSHALHAKVYAIFFTKNGAQMLMDAACGTTTSSSVSTVNSTVGFIFHEHQNPPRSELGLFRVFCGHTYQFSVHPRGKVS